MPCGTSTKSGDRGYNDEYNRRDRNYGNDDYSNRRSERDNEEVVVRNANDDYEREVARSSAPRSSQNRDEVYAAGPQVGDRFENLPRNTKTINVGAKPSTNRLPALVIKK